MVTDFIVIGSGLAGLTSALVLQKYEKVLLLTKKKLTDCATDLAQGGIAAVISKPDSFPAHINDTLLGGCFHNKKKAVEFLIKKGPAAIKWLIAQGVYFDKDDGNFALSKEAVHSYPRVLHATDFTGKIIEKVLVEKAKEAKNIKIWQNCFVNELLVADGCCFGVQVVKEGKIFNLFSRVTILATGGLGQLYLWTTNPEVATGDGLTMAYRAGAELSDLEFIQFHPTALKHGTSPLFLLSEALRGEGAYLIKIKDQRSKIKNNKGGERFMERVDPRVELAPRDIVARAIFKEQQGGYEVYLDIRHRGKNFIRKRFPNIYKELKKRGFDLAKEMVPVAPAAHYSCGGVKVDLCGRTSIAGLFAFGEVACSGVHGANRLASNSLLEAVVFPLKLKSLISKTTNRIEKNSFCHPEGVKRLKDPVGFFENERDPSPRHSSGFRMTGRQKDLKRLMWEKVGIIRTRKGLEEALGQIKEWEGKVSEEKRISRDFLELRNMLLVARLITQAALRRKESLGVHFVVEN